MTSFLTCKFFGQFAVLGIFSSQRFISENYLKFASEDWGYKIAKVDSCKLTVPVECLEDTGRHINVFFVCLHDL